MRPCPLILVALLALASGCGRPAEVRQYELRGQVLGVDAERREVLIKHQDITGFMPAMTMPFKVRDAALLTDRRPGDLITATLVVGDVEAYLSAIAKTGEAPLETPAATGAQQILAPGEPVADAPLVDQDGRTRGAADLRGHRTALTFVYTRCPLVEFCPRLVYHFRTVQQMVKSDPALADVRLLAVTMDPEFDTPAVLAPYATRVGADTAVFSFLTGQPADVARFASQFGLYVERNPDNAVDITHNLVTAVVDGEGRLVKLHTGNDWTPKQLVADLSAIPAPAH